MNVFTVFKIDPTLTFKPFNMEYETPQKIFRRAGTDKSNVSFFSGNPSNAIYHAGYLAYLSKAWKNHCSVVLAPDNIWYMILCELTTVIAKSPKEYSHLFTTSPDSKQLIAVSTNDISSIDPELIIKLLREYVPTKVDNFLPKFSTSTLMSTLAMNVAFCDMVSPYYSYGTYCCGIPSIRIDGTVEDWTLVQEKLTSLLEVFSGALNKYISKCLFQITQLIIACENHDEYFFKKMVKLESCGSGSQYEMDGWIMQFLVDSEKTLLEGLPPHMSKMDYTNLDTNRTFSLFSGVFYSEIKNGFLIPRFDAFKFETTNDMHIDP